MLQRTLILGTCFLMLVGCSAPDPQRRTESEVVERVTQESDSVPQEQSQLAEEKGRETKRQSILAKIKPLEQEMELLSEGMQGRQQKISAIELQKNQLETELETYNRKVKAFIMDHKIETACIGALGMSLSEDNQYSQDAKDAAAVVTVGCGIGAFANGDFGKKVLHVVNQLNQAASYAKDLQSQISSVASQIDAETQQLEAEKAALSKLKSTIQEYQAQLEAV